MTRRVLSKAQCAIIEPYCLGKFSDPGATPVFFWKRSYGSSVPGQSGVKDGLIWHVEQSIQEVPQVGQSGYFLPYIQSTSPVTELEYAMIDGTFVKVRRSGQCEKGDPMPDHWAFTRGHNDEDTGPDRRGLKPRRFLTDARTSPQSARDRYADQRPVRRAPSGRHGH